MADRATTGTFPSPSLLLSERWQKAEWSKTKDRLSKSHGLTDSGPPQAWQLRHLRATSPKGRWFKDLRAKEVARENERLVTEIERITFEERTEALSAQGGTLTGRQPFRSTFNVAGPGMRLGPNQVPVLDVHFPHVPGTLRPASQAAAPGGGAWGTAADNIALYKRLLASGRARTSELTGPTRESQLLLTPPIHQLPFSSSLRHYSRSPSPARSTTTSRPASHTNSPARSRAGTGRRGGPGGSLSASYAADDMDLELHELQLLHMLCHAGTGRSTLPAYEDAGDSHGTAAGRAHGGGSTHLFTANSPSLAGSRVGAGSTDDAAPLSRSFPARGRTRTREVHASPQQPGAAQDVWAGGHGNGATGSGSSAATGVLPPVGDRQQDMAEDRVEGDVAHGHQLGRTSRRGLPGFMRGTAAIPPVPSAAPSLNALPDIAPPRVPDALAEVYSGTLPTTQERFRFGPAQGTSYPSGGPPGGASPQATTGTPHLHTPDSPSSPYYASKPGSAQAQGFGGQESALSPLAAFAAAKGITLNTATFTLSSPSHSTEPSPHGAVRSLSHPVTATSPAATSPAARLSPTAYHQRLLHAFTAKHQVLRDPAAAYKESPGLHAHPQPNLHAPRAAHRAAATGAKSAAASADYDEDIKEEEGIAVQAGALSAHINPSAPAPMGSHLRSLLAQPQHDSATTTLKPVVVPPPPSTEREEAARQLLAAARVRASPQPAHEQQTSSVLAGLGSSDASGGTVPAPSVGAGSIGIAAAVRSLHDPSPSSPVRSPAGSGALNAQSSHGSPNPDAARHLLEAAHTDALMGGALAAVGPTSAADLGAQIEAQEAVRARAKMRRKSRMGPMSMDDATPHDVDETEATAGTADRQDSHSGSPRARPGSGDASEAAKHLLEAAHTDALTGGRLAAVGPTNAAELDSQMEAQAAIRRKKTERRKSRLNVSSAAGSQAGEGEDEPSGGAPAATDAAGHGFPNVPDAAFGGSGELRAGIRSGPGSFTSVKSGAKSEGSEVAAQRLLEAADTDALVGGRLAAVGPANAADLESQLETQAAIRKKKVERRKSRLNVSSAAGSQAGDTDDEGGTAGSVKSAKSGAGQGSEAAAQQLLAAAHTDALVGGRLAAVGPTNAADLESQLETQAAIRKKKVERRKSRLNVSSAAGSQAGDTDDEGDTAPGSVKSAKSGAREGSEAAAQQLLAAAHTDALVGGRLAAVGPTNAADLDGQLEAQDAIRKRKASRSKSRLQLVSSAADEEALKKLEEMGVEQGDGAGGRAPPAQGTPALATGQQAWRSEAVGGVPDMPGSAHALALHAISKDPNQQHRLSEEHSHIAVSVGSAVRGPHGEPTALLTTLADVGGLPAAGVAGHGAASAAASVVLQLVAPIVALPAESHIAMAVEQVAPLTVPPAPAKAPLSRRSSQELDGFEDVLGNSADIDGVDGSGSVGERSTGGGAPLVLPPNMVRPSTRERPMTQGTHATQLTMATHATMGTVDTGATFSTQATANSQQNPDELSTPRVS